MRDSLKNSLQKRRRYHDQPLQKWETVNSQDVLMSPKLENVLESMECIFVDATQSLHLETTNWWYVLAGCTTMKVTQR